MAVPTSPDPAQWNFIHTIGANLRKSFKDIDAVFSPACIEHTAITKEEWIEVEVDGVSLPDALFCWSSSLPDAVNANLGISAGRIIPSSSLDLTDNTRKRYRLVHIQIFRHPFFGGFSRKKSFDFCNIFDIFSNIFTKLY